MTRDITALIAELDAALIAAGECFDPAMVADARAALGDAARRFDQVGDHTVVALVGGTGSGKSSLFNALTRTDFADDGYIRPTTRRASACVWGRPADALLDFLGVDRSRRMTADVSARGSDAELDGLVLLDLPDHDSIEETHLQQVNALLPVVDVLAWVVDPQKYADHLLHENYLRVLSRRSDAMVVILNQSDTVTDAGRDEIVADVRRLLEEDGLADVEVLTTCALDGSGVDALWARLSTAVSQETTARRTVEAEVSQIASGVLDHLGPREAVVDSDVIDSAVDELVAATGVPAVTDAIRGARGRLTVQPQPPGRATVAAIGSSWAARATEGLPPRWADAVEEKLPSVPQLQFSSAGAVESVPLPVVRSRGAVVALFGAIALVLLSVGEVLWALSLDSTAFLIGAAIGAVAALSIAAYLFFGVVPALRRAAAGRAAQRYEEEVRDAVREQVRDVLVLPTTDVLERHAAVREAFEHAASQ